MKYSVVVTSQRLASMALAEVRLAQCVSLNSMQFFLAMAQVLNALEDGLGKFSFIINIVFGLFGRNLAMETQTRLIAEGRMNPVEIALEGLALTEARVGCFDAVDAFIDSKWCVTVFF